jgi:hypothetical protein
MGETAQPDLYCYVACYCHALHSLARLGAHGDPVAGAIVWDRETAMSVIAGVSALAAQAAADRASRPAGSDDNRAMHGCVVRKKPPNRFLIHRS